MCIMALTLFCVSHRYFKSFVLCYVSTKDQLEYEVHEEPPQNGSGSTNTTGKMATQTFQKEFGLVLTVAGDVNKLKGSGH